MARAGSYIQEGKGLEGVTGYDCNMSSMCVSVHEVYVTKGQLIRGECTVSVRHGRPSRRA